VRVDPGHHLQHMPAPSSRRLLPLVLAYLPLPIVGAALSVAWNVGASPGGRWTDMFLRGTALTPPLFLPAMLVAGSVTARRSGAVARAGAGATSLVATAFLAGSTANLRNDVAAARAAGTPVALTVVLAGLHASLSIGLLYHAVPTLIRRTAPQEAPEVR
jgi:hypothetical protein